jgi:hypothetical protein
MRIGRPSVKKINQNDRQYHRQSKETPVNSKTVRYEGLAHFYSLNPHIHDVWKAFKIEH